MAERQVGHLDETIFARPHEEIDVAAATQIVIFGEARISHDAGSYARARP